MALNAGRYHPTIMLSYMVGAVDSITQASRDGKGFSDFMRKYDPTVSDELLEYFHSNIRSAHWHGGEFAMGENESSWKEPLTNPDNHLRFFIMRSGRRSIRTAILNWIFAKIIK